jgi:hypothetical protein
MRLYLARKKMDAGPYNHFPHMYVAGEVPSLFCVGVLAITFAIIKFVRRNGTLSTAQRALEV